MRFEFPDDRWARLGVAVKYLAVEDGFWTLRKNGDLKSFYKNKFTELVQCQLCSKSYSPIKVAERTSCTGWEAEGYKDYYSSRTVLCTGCWNKVKPIAKAKKLADEQRILNNELKRSIGKWEKSQQQAI